MNQPIRNKPFYKPLIWTGAALCFLIIFWFGMGLVTNPEWFMGDDFVEYWAAGKLNLTGGDPYDPNQLHPLELQTGVIEGEAVMMWNPPWMLIIAMPFGSLGYAFSRTLWMVLNIILIFICLNELWTLYGGQVEYRWVAWILGFSFVPVLDGLKKGQTSILLLIGVVGFLYFVKRRHYWLAGISLSLLAVEPHILYLFLIAVIIWSIDQKQWKIVLGFFAALAVATTLSWIVNPLVIQQYIFAVKNFPPSDWATATIGGLLRIFFGTERFWLQFLPPLLGFSWLVYYWLRLRSNWDWLEQTPILILGSTLTAAYGWSWDQTVSIIAILQIAVLLLPLKKNLSTALIISSYVLIDGLTLTIRANQLWLFWLAPALLIWYLASKRILRNSELPVQSNATD